MVICPRRYSVSLNIFCFIKHTVDKKKAPFPAAGTAEPFFLQRLTCTNETAAFINDLGSIAVYMEKLMSFSF